MKVIVKKDSTDIFPHLFEDSVLQNVRTEGDNYVGIFTSMFGSYYVEVPKKRCKKYKEKNTLNGRLAEWFRRRSAKPST
jgi:hypothetical protein